MSSRTSRSKPRKPSRNQQILQLAAAEFEREGELELDRDGEKIVARISEGGDNGAYVQMWRWVDFSGTDLCKDPDTCNHTCKVHG